MKSLLKLFHIPCRYLTGKIEEGEAHNITCPGFQCSMLVPVDMIEKLVSRDMARRFLQFDIKVLKTVAYIMSKQMSFCPSVINF